MDTIFDLRNISYSYVGKTEGRFGIHGREVGRINPAGMQASEVPGLIQELDAGRYTGGNPVQVMAEPKWHHSCQLCSLEGE
jgi:hypothetical protein